MATGQDMMSSFTEHEMLRYTILGKRENAAIPEHDGLQQPPPIFSNPTFQTFEPQQKMSTQPASLVTDLLFSFYKAAITSRISRFFADIHVGWKMACQQCLFPYTKFGIPVQIQVIPLIASQWTTPY